MKLTKDHSIDRRTSQARDLETAGRWFIITLVLIALAILFKSLKEPNKPIVAPVKPEELKIELPQVVYASEPDEPFEIMALIRRKGQALGIDDYTITRFIQVAKCESGLNPDAMNKNRNGTFDVGLYQINSVHKQKNMTDVERNIDYAYSLFIRQGFSPWLSSSKCWNK